MSKTKKIITITDIDGLGESIECIKSNGEYESAVMIHSDFNRYEVYCRYMDGDEADPINLEDREPMILNYEKFKKFREEFLEHLLAF